MKEKVIAELMYLSLLVHLKTEYCVFLDLSGHVDWLEIKIRKSKEEYNKEIAHSRFYFDESYSQKRADEIKKLLIDILEKGKIDYTLCAVEEWSEVHRNYVF